MCIVIETRDNAIETALLMGREATGERGVVARCIFLMR